MSKFHSIVMKSFLAPELLKRVIVLALVCGALAVLPAASPVYAGSLFAAVVAVYFAFPATARPQQALFYERVPAVYGPDAVGLLLTAVLFALPFWARMGEPYLWDDFGILVHPSALLTWPLAVIAASILWFSAGYDAFWLVIEDDGLRINRLDGLHVVPFSAIKAVKPMRSGLPRWVRWLSPFLIVAGRYEAAGSILLARDSHGITVVLTDASELSIAQEAFEKPMRRLVSALRKHHVRFDEELAA